MELSNNQILEKQKVFVDLVNTHRDPLGLKKITWSQKTTVAQAFEKIDAAVSSIKDGVEIPEEILSRNNELTDIYEEYIKLDSESSSVSVPDVIPEPEVIPEVIPEPEVIPAPEPEVIPAPAPEVIPEPVPEVIPEPVPEVIPAPEVIPVPTARETKRSKPRSKPRTVSTPTKDDRDDIILVLFSKLSDKDIDELDTSYTKEILKIMRRK